MTSSDDSALFAAEPPVRLMRGDWCWRREADALSGPFKVMAVADGYAMIRRPHCYPAVEPIGDLVPAAPGEVG